MNIPIDRQFLRGYLLEKGTFGIRKRETKKGKYLYPYVRVIIRDQEMLGAVSAFFTHLRIKHTICNNSDIYITSQKSLGVFLKNFNYEDCSVWSKKPKYQEVIALLNKNKNKR